MIDFLYTHKPLLKTSNYHESCDIGMSGSTENFERPPWTGRKENNARNLSCTLSGGNPRWTSAETNRRGQGGHVSQTKTGLQSLLRWDGPTLEQYLKHMEISSECKFVWSVRRTFCWKESNLSKVKYSLGFSSRNHPEVCVFVCDMTGTM